MSMQYMYFLNAEGNQEALKGLIHKLSTKAGPGAIIQLTGAEHKLVKSMVVVPIGPPPVNVPIPNCEHGEPMNKTCIQCGRFERASVQPEEGNS